MQPSTAELLIQLAPLMLLATLFAIGAGYLAPKIGASPVLWVILLLIPFVNFFAVWAFAFRVAGAMLDKLNAISGHKPGSTST